MSAEETAICTAGASVCSERARPPSPYRYSVNAFVSRSRFLRQSRGPACPTRPSNICSITYRRISFLESVELARTDRLREAYYVTPRSRSEIFILFIFSSLLFLILQHTFQRSNAQQSRGNFPFCHSNNVRDFVSYFPSTFPGTYRRRKHENSEERNNRQKHCALTRKFIRRGICL